ncbi:MAG: hypothetical protein K2Y37_06770 [Pirellulales bacterium]|nr:hypothetical protein [Pirellulales bacterium]
MPSISPSSVADHAAARRPTPSAPHLPDATPIQEFVHSRDSALRVDRAGAVIRGVKILGLESENGRSYLPSALTAAVPLYEGAKVNVNHAKGHPAAPRDYQDRIGRLRAVHFRAGAGLFGDLYLNPRHTLAEQLLWDAAHAPENVGFSHNVQARTAQRDGRTIVESIVAVHSVDLVADPATTRGLFEACDTTPRSSFKSGDDPASRATARSSSSAVSNFALPGKPAVAPIPDFATAHGQGGEAARVGDVAPPSPPPSPPAPASSAALGETLHRPLASCTLTELRAARPDLVMLLLTEEHDVRQALEARVAEVEAREALACRRQRAVSLLAEFGLPNPQAADGATSHLVDPTFFESLLAAPDERAQRALVADRARLVAEARRLPAEATIAPLPRSREQQATAGAGHAPRNVKEFVRAIT